MKILKRRIERLDNNGANSIAIVIVPPGVDPDTVPIEYNGITFTGDQFAKAYPNGHIIRLVAAK